ncbi:MAG: leucine-rich repeat domain-containing protein [Anaeroplasmataceae bacterium]|nr:leucine-rich repeat domain-containing protein [Anaeroplasmataceae bacterium]
MTRRIKIASIFLFCLCMGLLIVSCGKKEENKPSVENTNFEFQLNEDKMSYSVSAKKGVEYTEVVIPSTYKNTPVTTIARNAFADCTNIKSITISDSVTTIDKYAFSDCRLLSSIIISSSVKNIAYNAFFNCIVLENVFYEGTIKDWCGIEFENDEANPMYFADRFFLKNDNQQWEEVTCLKIPEGVTELKRYQFYGFNHIVSIILPKSLKKMEYNCIDSNKNITNVFYEGNINDLYEFIINTEYILNTDWYIFSEAKPTDTDYSYWHYVDGVATKW